MVIPSAQVFKAVGGWVYFAARYFSGEEEFVLVLRGVDGGQKPPMVLHAHAARRRWLKIKRAEAVGWGVVPVMIQPRAAVSVDRLGKGVDMYQKHVNVNVKR